MHTWKIHQIKMQLIFYPR